MIGGSKEEFIDYLYENCTNLKTKKVVQSKKWITIRRIFLGLCLLIFGLAIIFSLMNSNRMEKYEEVLEDKGYKASINEHVNDGYTSKTMIVMSGNSSNILYVYDFKNERLAKHNLEYWAEREADNKDEYIKADSGNYKKYVIDNDGYVVLIRKGNFVIYGKGSSRYKDELDDMIKVID